MEHLGGADPSPSRVSVPEVPSFTGGRSGGGGGSDQWGPGKRGLDAASGTADLGEVVGWLAVLFGTVIGIGASFIYSAETMLPDIANHAFRATFLDPDAWLFAILRSSWLAFACVFAVTVKLGLSIHHNFPAAIRLADVFAK
jgi:hypothetical protein